MPGKCPEMPCRTPNAGLDNERQRPGDRMNSHRFARSIMIGVILTALAACGGGGGGGLFGGGLFGGGNRAAQGGTFEPQLRGDEPDKQGRSKLGDLFNNSDNPNTTLEVNRYLWAASLEVLNFLPIQSVDPFSGVIVTGYGTPPGGGRAYRATVLVQDPAMDARSLKLSLQTKGGAVDPATVRAVEDAILTRARQLRAQDSKL